MKLQFLSAQRIKVQSHNEYQSNRVMNRNAVRGRQAKLRDPHDTTRVVNVSISVSSLSASHEYDRKMLMEEQMTISGVARIWCEGNTKRGVDCEDRNHCPTYGRPIRPWPLNFRPRPQTPAGASSLDPLENFVLQTP